MTAWETLVSNSTIPSGTAWEHLLAQGGGTGPGELVLYDGMEILLDSLSIDVELEPIELDVEIEDSIPEIIVEIEDTELSIDDEETGVEI